MGVEEAWKHVLEHVERSAEHKDEHDNGERIVGVGEEVADQHIIFDPLSDAELEELAEDIGRAVPDELGTFYTRCANGVILFGEELSIYGLRVEGRAQPWDLGMHAAEAPPGAEEHMFFFGSWGDAHPLFIDTRDGSVHGASRQSAESLRRWDSLADFLVQESDRLAALFDPDGTRKEPYGSAPEEQEADARGERPTTYGEATVPAEHGDRLEHVVKAIAGLPDDGVDFYLAELEITGRDDGGVRLKVAGGFQLERWDGWRDGWLEIATDGAGDPWLVDLTSDDLPVHWISSDTDSTERVASSLERFGEALRIAADAKDPKAAFERISEADPDIDPWVWESAVGFDPDEDEGG